MLDIFNCLLFIHDSPYELKKWIEIRKIDEIVCSLSKIERVPVIQRSALDTKIKQI